MRCIGVKKKKENWRQKERTIELSPKTVCIKSNEMNHPRYEILWLVVVFNAHDLHPLSLIYAKFMFIFI